MIKNLNFVLIILVQVFLFINATVIDIMNLQKPRQNDGYLCRNCRMPSECEILNDYYAICHCKPGVKGKNCERLLVEGENLCASNPCWNGGHCISNSTSWTCICPAHLSTKNCRHYPNYDDLVVKVLNKGLYLAQITLYYKRAFSNGDYIKKIVPKSSSEFLTVGKEVTLKMPYDTDISSIYLVGDVIAGNRIFSTQITKNLSCFHIWGSTLFPYWSPMECW